MSHVKLQLVLNDDKDTPVARFHRKQILKKEAKLEIIEGAGGERILDQIIFTFIYVEMMRRRREQAARAG